MNSIDNTYPFIYVSFLHAPAEPDSLVANTEGEMVAWCMKPGRGTHVIPAGVLAGMQFIKTPAYASVIEFIDQTKINIAAGDFGGEMDPHIEWYNFIGGDFFCFKACDPADKDAAPFCKRIFDCIGCAYNVPNNAQNDTFESCLGDNQDFPGVYTKDGQVLTYTQPPESLGPITSMPYTARVPESSNCVAFKSADVFDGGVVTSANPQSTSNDVST
ncbi:hypothetical protein BDQ12DRAFT_726198 [Crucibulum laeve]|uniref:Uncharacterized protein n=1 Tax=Crucibulum laeve TaxID=68775 RepID=A0A5C3LR03_9AGAR|nr:hypothetical protein BDQ12DRAFT_726198 [Crucibulum laeve]